MLLFTYFVTISLSYRRVLGRLMANKFSFSRRVLSSII